MGRTPCGSPWPLSPSREGTSNSPEERIEGYKHFINKIWNAARLLLMNLKEGTRRPSIHPARPARTVHRWILSRVQRVIEGVQSDIEGYHFNQYANAMYQSVPSTSSL